MSFHCNNSDHGSLRGAPHLFLTNLRALKRPAASVLANEMTPKYAQCGKVVSNDGSSHHSSQKRPTLTHGATPCPSGHQTHQTTHTQPKQGGRDRPGRPPPVSGGMGFAPAPEAPDPAPSRTGGTLRPCRRRRSGAPTRAPRDAAKRARRARRSRPPAAAQHQLRRAGACRGGCAASSATSQLQRRATAARPARALKRPRGGDAAQKPPS